MALSFAATVAWVQPERLPDSAWISALVSIVAALQVLRSGPSILTTVTAGALAGIWSALLRIQGLPFVPALIVAAALPALSAYLTVWRPTFAPASLRDEALLGVLAFGLAVAVSPGVSSGWRSATALNLQGNHIVSQIPPGWVLGLVGASVALGGLYSLWVRHRTS